MNGERRTELGRFLKDRRARVNPADAGLPAAGRRRVRGLRREEVAALAGIGVSWYTALENGDARSVSEQTLLAVAGALRLSQSERQYLLALAGHTGESREFQPPDALTTQTVQAMRLPAYVITASWDVSVCNAAFRRIWGIAEHEVPFNAVARLFFDPRARQMHGEHFRANITPVIAMLHSSQGRQLYSETLGKALDQLMADPEARPIWDDYKIESPLLTNVVTIESMIGPFRYQTLTLPVPGKWHAIVVQVPDEESLMRLERA